MICFLFDKIRYFDGYIISFPSIRESIDLINYLKLSVDFLIGDTPKMPSCLNDKLLATIEDLNKSQIETTQLFPSKLINSLTASSLNSSSNDVNRNGKSEFFSSANSLNLNKNDIDYDPDDSKKKKNFLSMHKDETNNLTNFKSSQAQQQTISLNLSLPPRQHLQSISSKPSQADCIDDKNNKLKYQKFDMMDCEFYHPNIDRVKTEKSLHKDGDFLIRLSTSVKNQYIISLNNNGKFNHIALNIINDKVIMKGQTFTNIIAMVEFMLTSANQFVTNEGNFYVKRGIPRHF